MNEIFDRILNAARQLGASDIHLKVDSPPIFRLKGAIRTVRDVPPMSAAALDTFAYNVINEEQHAALMTGQEIDVAYTGPKGGRYRVNVFRQRGKTGMVLRVISTGIPSIESLGLPDRVRELCSEARGLILVTGITGSGKSTTLAAMVERMNIERAAHIITIEDPIEYSFEDRRAIINQREVGFDTKNFSEALRAALRQDPDVILVGEMRDYETMRTALHAAETGHLVLSTLHTIDAKETIARIVQMFPPHEQGAIRLQVAAVLRAVISQRLLPGADGKSMQLAAEVMINTPRIQEMITDPQRTKQITDAVKEGAHPYGMVSFDQCLGDLVRAGKISYETAVSASSNPDDFELAFNGVTDGAASDMQLGEF